MVDRPFGTTRSVTLDTLSPALLALTVTFDLGATLGLVLLAYEGPFSEALLPLHAPPMIAIAASLSDLLALVVFRSINSLLPLFGVNTVGSSLSMAFQTLCSGTIISWMLVKLIFAARAATGKLLEVEGTRVTMHLPLLLGAEVLAALVTVFEYYILVMSRPALLSRHGMSPGLSNVSSQRQFLEKWLQESVDEQILGSYGHDKVPLLPQTELDEEFIDCQSALEPCAEDCESAPSLAGLCIPDIVNLSDDDKLSASFVSACACRNSPVEVTFTNSASYLTASSLHTGRTPSGA